VPSLVTGWRRTTRHTDLSGLASLIYQQSQAMETADARPGCESAAPKARAADPARRGTRARSGHCSRYRRHPRWPWLRVPPARRPRPRSGLSPTFAACSWSHHTAWRLESVGTRPWTPGTCSRPDTHDADATAKFPGGKGLPRFRGLPTAPIRPVPSPYVQNGFWLFVNGPAISCGPV
jgi:hypothetical protein